MGQDNGSIMNQIDKAIISKVLEEASNEDMLFEVVTTALQYIKENPLLEPSQALVYSHADWIK